MGLNSRYLTHGKCIHRINGNKLLYSKEDTGFNCAAAHQEITIEWWENALPNFEPFISQVVLDEIERGDSDAAEMRCETAKNFKLIEVTEETVNLAEIYFKVFEIPDKAKADTFHYGNIGIRRC